MIVQVCHPAPGLRQGCLHALWHGCLGSSFFIMRSVVVEEARNESKLTGGHPTLHSIFKSSFSNLSSCDEVLVLCWVYGSCA